MYSSRDTDCIPTIHAQVYAASQQSLKEKYEGELKKEIKKLQRLRDQIKTWLGSGDIKDKNPLTEARKLIETKMEQFKVCEKDTKTKAFSKEGLAREAKADPEEAERQERRDWINECLEKLNDVIDSVESEMEKLSSGRGKNKNKSELEKLDNRVKKNRWHIGRLELILKLLDNMDLEPSALESIKEDVEYYIESAVDDDGALGVDDEFDIYEEMNLEALTGGPLDGGTGGDSNEGSPRADTEGSKAGGGGAADEKDDAGKSKKATTKAAEANPIAMIGKATAKKEAATLPVGKAAKAAEKATGKDAKNVLPSGAPGKVDKKGAAAGKDAEGESAKKAAEDAESEPKAEVPAPVPTAWSNDKPATQMLAQVADPPAPTPAPASATIPSAAVLASTPAAGVAPAPPMPAKPAGTLETASDPVAPVPVATNNSDSTPAIGMTIGGPAMQPKPAQPMILGASTTSPAANLLQPQAGQIPSQMPLGQGRVGDPTGSGSVTPNQVPGTPSQSGQPAVGASNASYGIPGMGGLGGVSGQQPPPVQHNKLANAPPETLAALNMLKSSMVFSPENAEIEKQPNYQPRNPYNGAHASFPMAAPTMAESAALFEKLPMDSLFFAFYYQPGTYQQYLAAKQLKKHSWRFHKKYMTWFQRHEEPKIASDEFEEGTYVYFDYESGWCQRIKSEFKFEYAYLEDELPATGSS
jgi:CCR4-NOT transcription complex subunit 3